jgi:hypothetical protein
MLVSPDVVDATELPIAVQVCRVAFSCMMQSKIMTIIAECQKVGKDF